MFGTPLGCPRRSFGRLLVGVAFAGGLVHGSFSTGAQVPALTMHEDQLRQQAIDLLEPILGSTIEELTLDEFKSAAPLDGAYGATPQALRLANLAPSTAGVRPTWRFH